MHLSTPLAPGKPAVVPAWQPSRPGSFVALRPVGAAVEVACPHPVEVDRASRANLPNRKIRSRGPAPPMASPSQHAAPAGESVSLAELENLSTKALLTLGYTKEEAAVLLEVLMYAQLRDNNQGIVKITSGGLNKHAKEAPPAIEKETRLSALINGNNTSGMIVLHKATCMAVERAKQHGFGIVGTNHTPGSSGALGYYAELIGKQGLIGLVLAQSPEFVAPYGAKQAIFGTNPIAISVPTTPHTSSNGNGAHASTNGHSSNGTSSTSKLGQPRTCVTMDMATSSFAWFGLLEAKTAGKSIAGDIGMDAQGNATTDPAQVLAGGALRGFDRGPKGSALGLMVELLAGPLVGAAVEDKLAERNWGNLVVAVDPGLLGDPETIQQRVQTVLDRVKNAQRLPGVDEILLPGERGDRLAASRRVSGVIQIEPNLLASLRVMASKHGHPKSPSKSSRKGTSIATQLVHGTTSVTDPYGGSGAPLWQTATFAQPSATTFGPYDYTRSGNPTRTMLEEQMAALEGADKAFAFTSGMSAIDVVTKLVSSGEHIIAGEDIYGGTSRLLSSVVPTAGVSVTNVDMTDLEAVRRAIIPGKTKLMIIESPTNPRMQICDIKALTSMARAAGAISCVDNSIMAPVFQRPLDLGADISMTSGTKFIGGHGDVTLGILSVKGEQLAKRVYFLQNAEGAGLAPFDCWLALRGLKTMSLRMERSADNCAKLARYLAKHPLVKKVNYAGLTSDPGHALHMQQATHGGSLLSFETGSVEASKIVVEETQLFKITVSFGNVVSLISLPCYMSHASIPADVRAARGLPDDLVRISAGIEDVDDLIADLDQAMNKAMAQIGFDATNPPPGVGKQGSGLGSRGPSPGPAMTSEREAQLLDRIKHLEQLLKVGK